jgi:hypothetical protein
MGLSRNPMNGDIKDIATNLFGKDKNIIIAEGKFGRRQDTCLITRVKLIEGTF